MNPWEYVLHVLLIAAAILVVWMQLGTAAPAPHCPPGYHWDPQRGYCIPITSAPK